MDQPEVVQLRQAPIMAIKPTGEDVELAAVVTAPPAAELTPDAAPAPAAAQTLPSTASSLPLAGLLGFLALAGALGVRLMQQRVL